MTTVSGAAAATNQALISTGTKAGIGEEFNSFIKLLTAQVRNQDPLSPMDSTQFVQQLATFSSLEQHVRANAALASISAMMTQLNALAASEWLSQPVSIETGWIPYVGENVTYSVTPPDGTDATVLTIKDANGTTVWSETLAPGQPSYQWNGQLNYDGHASNGTMYQFVIETYRDGQLTGTQSPHLRTTVTDVITEEGRLRLETAAGVTVDIGQARKL